MWEVDGRKFSVGGHHGEKYNMYYIILYYMLYVVLVENPQKRKFSFFFVYLVWF